MTVSDTTNEAAKWQERYSASYSQVQDMKRTSIFILVIAFLLVVGTLYTVGYIIDQFENWLFETTSQFFFHILLIRLLLIFLTPTIMLLLGLRFIFKQAVEFIFTVYPITTDVKVSSFIRSRLLGVPPLPPPLNSMVKYPAVLITKPELEEDHWARWLGGPAVLVIQDGFAVYLERGNKFSRVVGPSSPPPFLERYEQIKEVVDLRPQYRNGYVEPWTKDGIPIKLTLNIEVQIHANSEALKKSASFRYQFDPLAVKAAVEYTSVRLREEKLHEQNWIEGAWGSITGAINAFVAGHSLDELFIAPLTSNHASPNHSHHEMSENIEQIFSQKISEQVTNDLRERLNRNGIEVLNIQITQLEIPQEILDLRTQYWESIKLRVSAQRNSRAEAEWFRTREVAHAEAQRTMLMAIIKRLENIPPEQLAEPLVLSLSSILDQGLDDPEVRPLIARETFEILDRVRKLLNEPF